MFTDLYNNHHSITFSSLQKETPDQLAITPISLFPLLLTAINLLPAYVFAYSRHFIYVESYHM